MSDSAPIPAALARPADHVVFRRHGGAWHLVGPAHLLPVGERVWVGRFGETPLGRIVSPPKNERPRRREREAMVEVVVTGYVAERVVRHREGSYTREAAGRGSTRYVVATFESPARGT